MVELKEIRSEVLQFNYKMLNTQEICHLLKSVGLAQFYFASLWKNVNT
jgi:hypothetical protein